LPRAVLFACLGNAQGGNRDASPACVLLIGGTRSQPST